MLCLRSEFNSNIIHAETAVINAVLTGALDSLPSELYITTFNFIQNLEETLATQL